MNPDWLFKHFEQISEVPDAVPRLRRFILELAVRGKLVEQDPEDEPASELLKRVTAEKRHLAEEGQIRKQKPLPSIREDEVPFNVPKNWKLVRLGEVSTLITKGSTPTSYGHSFVQHGINFVKVEAIKAGLLLPENITSHINWETHEFLKRSQLKSGDFLFSIAGSIGTCAVVTEQILPANTNQALAIIRGANLAFSLGYLSYSSSSDLLAFTVAKARGGAMNNISLEDVSNFILPLPPLAEQHRIVAKVDELMALCDKLEAAQVKRERRRDRLVAATLHGLNNGDDSPEPGGHPTFEESARFYFNHLPRLTTCPEHIRQLRQTILNLAVRGKLVPQDTKQQALTVESFEVPFYLPASWRWKTIGDLGKTQTGSTPPTVERQHYDGNIPFIKPAAISDGVINYEGQCLTESGVRESTLVHAGAILMVCIGGSIGKAALVNRSVCFNQQINSVSPTEGIDAHYLLFAMQSPYFRACVVNAAAQGTLPIISKGKWERLLIPVPPLAEQHQIVAKVDELMALCDELEARISTTATTRRQLLAATVSEAIAS